MIRWLLAAALPLTACSQGGNGDPVASSAPLVSNIAEANTAIGKRVRVRGLVQREKLGDTIAVAGLSIVCDGARFPDDAIGKIGEAEGTLEVGRAPTATIGTHGEISQGVAGDPERYMLRSCFIR